MNKNKKYLEIHGQWIFFKHFEYDYYCTDFKGNIIINTRTNRKVNIRFPFNDNRPHVRLQNKITGKSAEVPILPIILYSFKEIKMSRLSLKNKFISDYSIYNIKAELNNRTDLELFSKLLKRNTPKDEIKNILNIDSLKHLEARLTRMNKLEELLVS